MAIEAIPLGGNRWELAHETPIPHRGTWFVLPEGFRTDFASTPRFVHPLMGPTDLSIEGPLIHDFLYQCKGAAPDHQVRPYRTFTRSEADRIFREAMQEESIPGWKVWAAWLAVRLFGWRSWRVVR